MSSNEERTITKTVANRRIRSLSKNIALKYGVTVETREGEGESVDFIVISPTSNDEVTLITVIDPNKEIWDIVKRTEADFDSSVITFPFNMIQQNQQGEEGDETNKLGLIEELQTPEIKTPAEEFEEIQKEVREVVSETVKKPKIQHQPRPRVRPIVHRKN